MRWLQLITLNIYRKKKESWQVFKKRNWYKLCSTSEKVQAHCSYIVRFIDSIFYNFINKKNYDFFNYTTDHSKYHNCCRHCSLKMSHNTFLISSNQRQNEDITRNHIYFSQSHAMTAGEHFKHSRMNTM